MEYLLVTCRDDDRSTAVTMTERRWNAVEVPEPDPDNHQHAFCRRCYPPALAAKNILLIAACGTIARSMLPNHPPLERCPNCQAATACSRCHYNGAPDAN